MSVGEERDQCEVDDFLLANECASDFGAELGEHATKRFASAARLRHVIDACVIELRDFVVERAECALRAKRRRVRRRRISGHDLLHQVNRALANRPRDASRATNATWFLPRRATHRLDHSTRRCRLSKKISSHRCSRRHF